MSFSQQDFEKLHRLIQNGQRAQAAARLRVLLTENQDDYRIWLLLAMIAPPERREACIRRASDLAPTAPAVIKAVAWLARQETGPAAATVPTRFPEHKPRSVATTPAAVDRPQPRPAPSSVRHPAQPRSGRWAPRLLALTLFFALIAAAAAVGAYIRDRDRPEPAVTQNEPAPTVVFEADSAPLNAIDRQAADKEADPAPVVDLTATLPLPSPTSSPTPPPTATPQRLAAKNIAAASESRARWTPTPTPTNTPIPTPTIEPTAIIENYALTSWPEVGPNERWVDINLSTQTLIAYEGQTPVMETIISSGRAPYYTVTGQFRIYYRLESQTMDGRRLGFDYVTPGVPWVQYFYGDFALHGAFWHNDFGTPVSHGCVNMTVGDAEWLFTWADYGTLVSVHY